MGNFLPQLPGQQIASTRRRLVRSEQPQGYGWVTDDDGDIWLQPFGPGGGIYSYPFGTFIGKDSTNEGIRSTFVGMFGFLAMGVAIASYSMWDLLIMLTLSFGQSELTTRGYIPGLYAIGYGISGINGWLAGYLLARSISKRRTWGSIGGLMVLQNYIRQWWEGLVGVSHRCHFITLSEGFVAGLALEHFGPKQKPWKFIRKHIGKFVLAVMLVYFALGPILRNSWPDPPGYLDPHDPEVYRAQSAKLQAEIAEMELRHAEDERKNRERDAANEVFFRTWAPKTRRV